MKKIISVKSLKLLKKLGNDLELSYKKTKMILNMNEQRTCFIRYPNFIRYPKLKVLSGSLFCNN